MVASIQGYPCAQSGLCKPCVWPGIRRLERYVDASCVAENLHSPVEKGRHAAAAKRGNEVVQRKRPGVVEIVLDRSAVIRKLAGGHVRQRCEEEIDGRMALPEFGDIDDLSVARCR